MKRSGSSPFASSRRGVRDPFRDSTNTAHAVGAAATAATTTTTTTRLQHNAAALMNAADDGGDDDALIGTTINVMVPAGTSARATGTCTHANSQDDGQENGIRSHERAVRNEHQHGDSHHGEDSRSNHHQQDDQSSDGWVRLGDYAFANTNGIEKLRSECPTCVICSRETGTNIVGRGPLHRTRHPRHWECVLVACENCNANIQEALVCSGCAVNLECPQCREPLVNVSTFGSIELVLQRRLDLGYEFRSVAPDRKNFHEQMKKAFPQGLSETDKSVVAFPYGSLVFSCITAQKNQAEQVLRDLFVEPSVEEFQCPICECESFPTLLLLEQHKDCCRHGMDNDESDGLCLMNSPMAFYLSPLHIMYLLDLSKCNNNEDAKLDLLNATALPLQSAHFPLERLSKVKKAQEQVLTQHFLPSKLALRRVDVRATFNALSDRMLKSWKDGRHGAFPPFLVLPFLRAAEPVDDEASTELNQAFV